MTSCTEWKMDGDDMKGTDGSEWICLVYKIILFQWSRIWKGIVVLLIIHVVIIWTWGGPAKCK